MGGIGQRFANAKLVAVWGGGGDSGGGWGGGICIRLW